MCRLVPSEFDSMSTGARSGPSTSAWIMQPSASMSGMSFFLRLKSLRAGGFGAERPPR
jgi:hypothetical protein